MSALRLARASTGRDPIVKFAGGYHGHVDAQLVRAGSGALTLGVPDSPGVPAALATLTLGAEFNDTAGGTREVGPPGPGVRPARLVDGGGDAGGDAPPPPGPLHTC